MRRALLIVLALVALMLGTVGTASASTTPILDPHTSTQSACTECDACVLDAIVDEKRATAPTYIENRVPATAPAVVGQQATALAVAKPVKVRITITGTVDKDGKLTTTFSTDPDDYKSLIAVGPLPELSVAKDPSIKCYQVFIRSPFLDDCTLSGDGGPTATFTGDGKPARVGGTKVTADPRLTVPYYALSVGPTNGSFTLVVNCEDR